MPYFTDDFERSDRTFPDNGWTPRVGSTWVLEGGKVRMSVQGASNFGYLTRNFGAHDGRFEVLSSNTRALALRQSGSTFIYATSSAVGYYNGSAFSTRQTYTALVGPYWVVLSGAQVQVWQADGLKASVSVTENRFATNHGIYQSNGTTSTADAFIADVSVITVRQAKSFSLDTAGSNSLVFDLTTLPGSLVLLVAAMEQSVYDSATINNRPMTSMAYSREGAQFPYGNVVCYIAEPPANSTTFILQTNTGFGNLGKAARAYELTGLLPGAVRGGATEQTNQAASANPKAPALEVMRNHLYIGAVYLDTQAAPTAHNADGWLDYAHVPSQGGSSSLAVGLYEAKGAKETVQLSLTMSSSVSGSLGAAIRIPILHGEVRGG